MFKLERCDLWQKRYFIPLWLLQLALSVLLLVDFSIIAGVVNQFDGPDPVAAVLATLAAVSVFLSTVEIVLLGLHKLSPLQFVISNCLKIALWMFYLVIGIVATRRGDWPAIIIIVLLYAFIIGNLVYGSVIYHRQRMARRAKGEYELETANPDRAMTPVQTPGNGAKADPNVEIYPLTEHFAPQAPLAPQRNRTASPRLSPEIGKEIGSPNLQSSNGRQPTAAHPVYREPTEYYSPSPAGPSGTHTLPPPNSAQKVAALNARYDELETGPSGTYTLPPPHPAQRVAALNARYDELE